MTDCFIDKQRMYYYFKIITTLTQVLLRGVGEKNPTFLSQKNAQEYGNSHPFLPPISIVNWPSHGQGEDPACPTLSQKKRKAY